MKILWIYNQHHSSLEYDHWLHMHFAEYFNKIDGIELRSYGTNLQNYSSSLEYNKDKTLSDIYKEFNFDIIIVNTKGRCFDYYDPYKEIYGECLLPVDFKEWNKNQKIIIEEDYQYETESGHKWYTEHFDLLINRHKSNHTIASSRGGIKCEWMPFSVDVNTFKPSKEIDFCEDRRNKSNRINKVCFLGNSDHEIYSDRREAIGLLEAEGLIDNFGASRTNDEYIKTLQSYKMALCGVSTCDLTPSKIFEIVACGAFLVVNPTSLGRDDKTGIQELLPCAFADYNEFDNIVTTVKLFFNESWYMNSRIERGLWWIESKHKHEIRINQLIEMIKKL